MSQIKQKELAAGQRTPVQSRETSSRSRANRPARFEQSATTVQMLRGAGNQAVQHSIIDSGQQHQGFSSPEPGPATRAALAHNEPGSLLPSSIGHPLESVLGSDLGKVRVHSSKLAELAAGELRARAFASGQDIYFRAGAFNPTTPAGRQLIAHEAVHTVQQRAANHGTSAVVPAGHMAEMEASTIAQQIGITTQVPVVVRQQAHGLTREPDDATAGPPTATIQDLLNPEGTGFIIPELQTAYQSYQRGNKTPSGPIEWARHVTTGQPRLALVRLLGPDYAKGGSDAARMVAYREYGRPEDYTNEQLNADWQLLSSHPERMFDRLNRLLQEGVPQNEIIQGLLSILRGNIGELLSGDIQNEVLQRIRQTNPNAELLYGIRMQIILSDGTLSDPLMFSDNIIATIQPNQLDVHAVFETKVGPEGGSRAAWQIHRWIEKHLEDGVVIRLSDGRSFTYKGKAGQPNVAGLAKAERHPILASGVSYPQAVRTESGTTAPVTVHNMKQTTEQINYLSRLSLENLYAVRPYAPQPAGTGLPPDFLQSLGTRLQAVKASAQPGLPASVQAAMSKALAPLAQHQLAPRVLSAFEQIRDPDIVRDAIEKNGGRVILGHAVYRLSQDAGRVVTQEETPTPMALTIGASGAGSGQGGGAGRPGVGALPGSGGGTTGDPIPIPAPPGQFVTETPPVINLHPTRSLKIEGIPGTIAPSETTLQIGDYVVRGGQAEWLVCESQSGRPIAGVFSGGNLYRLVSPGQHTITIDAATGEIIPPTIVMVGGVRAVIEPVPVEPVAPAAPGAGGMRGGVVGAVGAVGGLLAVINDILAPYAAMQVQERANIRRAESEILFWISFGADPTWAIWDYGKKAQLDYKTPSQTAGAFIDDARYPYVIDINVDKFRQRLPGKINTFQDFELFLDMASGLGAIVLNEGRYRAVVNKPDRDNRSFYDVTDLIDQVRGQVTRNADAQMRAELGSLPQAELGNIFRLKSGKNTALYRSGNSQKILSSEKFLGDNPWVRTLGKTNEGGLWKWFRRGHYQDRLLVAPANAETLHASMNAAYRVFKKLEDVKTEVKDGGREIEHENFQNGELESFTALPDKETPPRFGRTVYLRDPNPDQKYSWTAAIGELKSFYVDASELEPVGVGDVQKYVKGPELGDFPTTAPSKDGTALA
jgi:Domain of unknown function (DUF4157)